MSASKQKTNKRPIEYYFIKFHDDFNIPVPQNLDPRKKDDVVPPGGLEPGHVLTKKLRALYHNSPGAIEVINRRMNVFLARTLQENNRRRANDEDKEKCLRYFSKLVYREIYEYFQRRRIDGVPVDVPRELPGLRGGHFASPNSSASYTTADTSKSTDSMSRAFPSTLTEQQVQEDITMAEGYFREQWRMSRQLRRSSGGLSDHELALIDSSILSTSTATSGRFSNATDTSEIWDTARSLPPPPPPPPGS